MSIFYQVNENFATDIETVTAVLNDGTVLTLTSESNDYELFLNLLSSYNRANSIRRIPLEERIRTVANPLERVKEVVALSDKIELRDGKLYFEDVRVKGRVAKHLKRMVDAGDGVMPLVNFLTKLQENPSEQSRESLYRWIGDRELTITEDGDFIAYKGLDLLGQSIHSGTAWVNSVKVTGQIPNPTGAVITMPRDKVDADVFQGCSYGLHAGTWKYASEFGQGMTVTVKINPADVVSVPSDCEDQKLRVCKYEVIEQVLEPHKVPVLCMNEYNSDEDTTDQEDSWDEYCDCGDYDDDCGDCL